jgi:hypothetical protein
LVEDIPTTNNTNNPSNKTVEANYEGGTYYFFTAQDPLQHRSVYGSSDIFAFAMFQPTLLGGTYAQHAEMIIEKYCHLHFLLVLEDPK